jgi:hypothetical protein
VPLQQFLQFGAAVGQDGPRRNRHDVAAPVPSVSLATAPGFLVPVGTATAGDRGRPAQLYRKGPAAFLRPPLLRAASP